MNAKQQGGFTMIELVMTITILGVLSAVAVPKFVDLRADAEAAVAKSVAASVTQAFSNNYVAYMANSAGANGSSVGGTSVGSAYLNSIATNMLGGGINGFSVTGSVACGGNGATQTVGISNNASAVSASATVTCTS